MYVNFQTIFPSLNKSRTNKTTRIEQVIKANFVVTQEITANIFISGQDNCTKIVACSLQMPINARQKSEIISARITNTTLPVTTSVELKIIELKEKKNAWGGEVA